MKILKVFIVLLSFVILQSCYKSDTETTHKIIVPDTTVEIVNGHYAIQLYEKKVDGSHIEILEIDSCEYIYKYGTALIHKENCRFCEERKTHE